MAAAKPQAPKTLYNDPMLSDVKIKQVCRGKTREYFAHKAVLCGQSSYFLKAFTGGFKEAIEAQMEIHDDDSDHFSFALEFIYTQHYDVKAIERVLDVNKRANLAQFRMGVHIIADKYGIPYLDALAMDNLQRTVEQITCSSGLRSVVLHHYSSCLVTGSTSGVRIVLTPFRSHSNFTCSKDFMKLCQNHPTFAADAMSSFKYHLCSHCEKTNFVHPSQLEASNGEYSVRCSYCRVSGRGWLKV